MSGTPYMTSRSAALVRRIAGGRLLALVTPAVVEARAPPVMNPMAGYEAYEEAGELLRALAAPPRIAIVTEFGHGPNGGIHRGTAAYRADVGRGGALAKHGAMTSIPSRRRTSASACRATG